MRIDPRTLAAGSLSLALLAASWSWSAATQLIRIRPASKADYVRLLEQVPEASSDAITVGDQVEFAASAERAAALSAQGYSVETVVPDLESYYAERLNPLTDFGAYHSYPEAVAALDALAAAHPDIMSPKQSMGTTLEGRDIWIYKISDNPTVQEDEPEIYFNAYIHAREPITFEVLYDLAQNLVNNYGTDPRLTAIVDSRQVWIQPVVNPDGVEYNRQTNPNGGGMWRKNRSVNPGGSRGVDLNRNFGYFWGYDNSGSSPYGSDETYRGTSAFSEAETQAMRDFVNAHEFRIAVNYHAYGGYHLMALGYDNLHHPDYDENLALGRIRRSTSGYNTGSTWEILYHTNGDANDWMWGDNQARPRILSFVSEVGTGSDGFWPNESRIPALVAENREANLRMCELADDPLRALPPGHSVVLAPDTVATTFEVNFTTPLPDPSNPVVSWNLIEATNHTVGIDNLEGSNQDRWTAEGWTWSTTRSHSASHSFHGGRADNLNNLLISRRGHRVASGEQLRFWTWYSTESGWDYGYVEVATEAGDFVSLPGSITTDSDPNGQNLGNGITGSSANWVQATFDLSAYEGQVIWVRFRYNTDGYTNREGWYVDDIEPSDLFMNESVIATGLTEPNYEFTNHLQGTYFYLAQSVDGEGDMAIWGPPKRVVIRSTTSAPPVAAGADQLRLEQIAGGPLSRGAALRATIPVSARAGEAVRLSVHDIAGREVALLRSGRVGTEFVAGGVFEALWEARDIPAGLYFARLSVASSSANRKLVHLR